MVSLSRFGGTGPDNRQTSIIPPQALEVLWFGSTVRRANMIGREQMQANMIGSEEMGEEGLLTLLLDYNCMWHLQAHLAFMTNNACMRSNECIYAYIFSVSLSLSRVVDSIRHCLLLNPHQMDYLSQMEQIQIDIHMLMRLVQNSGLNWA